MNGWFVQIAKLACVSAVVLLIGCSDSPDVRSKNLNQSVEPITAAVPKPAETGPAKSESPESELAPESPPREGQETAASEEARPESQSALATDAEAGTESGKPPSVDESIDRSESDPQPDESPVAQNAPEEHAPEEHTPVENAPAEEAEAVSREPSFRMLLPTTSGPLVADVEIRIGEQPLETAFDARILAVMDEASGDASDLTWTSLFDHVAADPQQFGRSSPINSQQHRNLIRRYDKNRNKKPDPDEVAKFLFRTAGFAGPFRLVGSDYFREINRSQSAVFVAMDRNGNRMLESDEVDVAIESLRRLDQNADERIDFREITSVAADDEPAWKNRRSSRWGEVAMDLSGYVDWSLLSYTLEEMPHYGPFGRKRNAIVKLDHDKSESVDREEARDLLAVEPDLRLRVQYPHAGSGQADIEIASVSSDLDPLVELTTSAKQICISGGSLRLIASVSDLRTARNQVPPQAFAMLDANNDGGLDESEIPEEALREYSFEDLDQDGDEKLSLREINEGMSPKSPIWNVQVRARGAETPDGVFAWLDQNQDHFLSSREINAAKDRLQAIASPEGNVKPSNIPDSYLLQFGRGDPGQDEQLFALTPPESSAMGAAPDAVSDSWPRWARSMDTNRDGEISRHEFPGASQQFDDLDKNADGFIEIDELSAR